MSRLDCHTARCEAAKLRRDQIYIKAFKQHALAIRSGVPFHRSLDDHLRDLGRDLCGTSSFVALGSDGAIFTQAKSVPPSLAAVMATNPVGRGVRIYELDVCLWQDIVKCLEMNISECLLHVPVRANVYACPFW